MKDDELQEIVDQCLANIEDAKNQQRKQIETLDLESAEGKDLLKAIRRNDPQKALVELTCGQVRSILKAHKPDDDTYQVYKDLKKGNKPFPGDIVCNVQACDILLLTQKKTPAPAK